MNALQNFRPIDAEANAQPKSGETDSLRPPEAVDFRHSRGGLLQSRQQLLLVHIFVRLSVSIVIHSIS